MKKTLLQLENIQHELTLEHKRRTLSIDLNLCPECGEPIIAELIEQLDIPETYFFGLFKRISRIWYHRTVCSADKTHYEYKYEYSDYM